MKEEVEGKEVLVRVPGNSLNVYKGKIDNYIKEHKPKVISVNFVADDLTAYAFYGNQKRYNRQVTKRKGRQIIIPSNVKSDCLNDIVINYHSLINRGYKYFENSTIMLFKLLKRLNPARITIAGFDGFKEELEDSYSDSSFQNDRHIGEFQVLNTKIHSMFNEIVETMSPNCEFAFIIPSLFE